MLEWIKLETCLMDDPRVRALMEDCQLAGLGTYVLIRSQIDAQSGRGLPLDYVLKIGAPYTRKGKILHVIRDYALFTEDEFGIVRACELAPAPGTPAHALPAPTLPMPASSAPVPSVDIENIRRFKKPTIEEIADYCHERQNVIDAEGFYYFYESKGWKVGGTPMKNWKAAVITWERKRSGSHAVTDMSHAESQSPQSPQRDVASQPVPEWAPPKPSPTAQWDFATDSWNEFY